MSITFNWANSSNLTTSNVGATSFNVGSTNAAGSNGSIAAGDYLQIVISTSWTTTDPGTISGPTGWIQITQIVNTGSQQRFGIWQKIAGASETGVYIFTWTNPIDRGISWSLTDRSGVSSSTPVDVSAAQHNPGPTYPTPTVTPTGSADLLVGIWADPGGQNPYAVDAAMTSRVVVQGTGLGFPMVAEGDVQLSSNATTSSYTMTTGTTSGNFGVLVALTPASGGGSPADDRAFQSGAMQALTLMRERASGLLEPVRELWKPRRPGFAF